MHGRDSDRGRAAVASIHRSLHPAPKDFARTPIFHGQSVQAQAAGSGVPGVMSVTVFHNRYLLFAPPSSPISPYPPSSPSSPHFLHAYPPPSLALSPQPFPFPTPLCFYHCVHMCLYLPHRQAPMFICSSPGYIFSISGEIYFFFFNGLIPFTF